MRSLSPVATVDVDSPSNPTITSHLTMVIQIPSSALKPPLTCTSTQASPCGVDYSTWPLLPNGERDYSAKSYPPVDMRILTVDVSDAQLSRRLSEIDNKAKLPSDKRLHHYYVRMVRIGRLRRYLEENPGPLKFVSISHCMAHDAKICIDVVPRVEPGPCLPSCPSDADVDWQ